MQTPRSRKPIAIPSYPPISRDRVADAHGRVSPGSSAGARVWMQVGRLFRPRSDHGVVHRRLSDSRSEKPPGSSPSSRGRYDVSAFRGATARFTALG
jgi:hypothetical protein